MPLAAYHFDIGAIHARVFADLSDPMTEDEIADIFPNDADRMRAAFRAAAGADLSFSANVLLLETAGRRMLVDTGVGALNPQQTGWLLGTLLAEGIAPESVDTVILTHFHMDHVGGLLDENGAAVFPSARLVASRAEHDYWMREEHLATLTEVRQRVLRGVFSAYPNVELLESDAEIAPGVRFQPLPGHTPGHCGLLIESQGARLLHIADTMHHTPMQLNLPDAAPRFDVLPDVAIATRRRVIERAASENLRLLAYHFAFPGLGHIHTRNGRYAWQPVEIA